MATRKPRRFNEGDLVEAADKAAGLKASSGEKVGLFERLRMGNIDDPNSEAYRRFGAGRGRAEKVPVEDRVATPVSRGMTATTASGMSDEDKPSTNVYRVDSGPGKISKAAPAKKPVTQSAVTVTSAKKETSAPAAQSYTRKMGATAQELAKPYTRKMGATAEETAKPYTRKMGATAEELAKPYTRKMGATAEGVASAEPPVSSRYPETRGSAQEALRSGSAAYKRYVESRATPSKNLLGEKSYRDRSDGGDAAYKKGGSVKGWGMARGARKAKIV